MLLFLPSYSLPQISQNFLLGPTDLFEVVADSGLSGRWGVVAGLIVFLFFSGVVGFEPADPSRDWSVMEVGSKVPSIWGSNCMVCMMGCACALPAAVTYPALERSSPDKFGNEALGLSRNSDKLGMLKSEGLRLSRFRLSRLSN